MFLWRLVMANEIPSGDAAVFGFLELYALAFAFEGVSALLHHDPVSFAWSFPCAVVFFVAGIKWKWLKGRVTAGWTSRAKSTVTIAALIVCMGGALAYASKSIWTVSTSRPWLFVDGFQVDKKTGEVHVAFINKRADPAQRVALKRWEQWGREAPLLDSKGQLTNKFTIIKEGDTESFPAVGGVDTLSSGGVFIDVWVAPTRTDYPVVQTLGTVTYGDGGYTLKFCFQTTSVVSAK